MEYCDGPIIMDECCLNCIHSVERKNGIACGDRGFLLRMLMGLRQIENPNIAKCNRFEHIPSVTDKLCKYCEYYSIHHDMPSCVNASLYELVTRGPRRVSPTGTCESFTMEKCFRPRNWKSR